MIHGLNVENYKSLRDIQVEFGDLTVLVGENNSGKSALFESLLYLKNVEGARYPNDVNSPDFMPHRFTKQNVFYRDGSRTAQQISVIPKLNFRDQAESDELEDKLLSNDIINRGGYPSYIWTGFSISNDGWAPRIYLGEISDSNALIEDSTWDNNELSVKFSGQSNTTLHISNGALDATFRSGKERHKNILSNFYEVLRREITGIYYISDNRGVTQAADDPEEHDFVGYQGENTVSWLHALRDDEDTFNRIVDAVTKISPDIADVRADLHGANTITELADSQTNELFNIVTSGAGLRKLLPIIVQIAAAEEGDTVIIEEPEIGVYPKTQERLVEFMLEAIEEQNIQILLSTHGVPFTWKIQNMADPSIGNTLKFEKQGGESIVEEFPLDRIPVEEYYGEK